MTTSHFDHLCYTNPSCHISSCGGYPHPIRFAHAEFSHIMYMPLANLFNNSLDRCVIPDYWWSSYNTHTYQVSKKTLTKNQLPIHLMHSLCIFLERIIHDSIAIQLEGTSVITIDRWSLGQFQGMLSAFESAKWNQEHLLGHEEIWVHIDCHCTFLGELVKIGLRMKSRLQLWAGLICYLLYSMRMCVITYSLNI